MGAGTGRGCGRGKRDIVTLTAQNSRRQPVEGLGEQVLHRGSVTTKISEEASLGVRQGRPKWQLGYEQDVETGAGETVREKHIWLWRRNGGFSLRQLGARGSVLKS